MGPHPVGKPWLVPRLFSRRTPRRAAQPRCLRLRSSAADTAAAARCRPRDSGRPAVRHPGRGHPGGILETIEKNMGKP